MRYVLASLAVLASIAPAYAQQRPTGGYVLIRMALGGQRENLGPDGRPLPPNAQQPGLVGVPGAGAIGVPPGGGFGVLGGGFNPGGGQGVLGGGFNPGGAAQPGGGFGRGGFAPGGFPGAEGGVPFDPIGGMPGGFRGAASGGDTEAYSVSAAVEVIKFYQYNPRYPVQAQHKYLPAGGSVTGGKPITQGWTTLYNNNEDIQVVLLPGATANSMYDTKYRDLIRNRTPQKTLELAEWCLSHGLVDKADDLLETVAKDEEKDRAGEGKANVTLSPAAKAAALAYRKVKADLAKPGGRSPETASVRQQFGPRVHETAHYEIVFGSRTSEAEARGKMLEENLKAIALWFAAKGVPLTLPSNRLTAVQIEKVEDYIRQRASFEDDFPTLEAFLDRRGNVVFFSSQRLDPASLVLDRVIQGLIQAGWDRNDLLMQYPKSGSARTKAATAQEGEIRRANIARAQTIILLEKALDEEAMRAGITHEGTRQLLTAVGLVVPSVEMPIWLQFGMPAVFETPKGPFPTPVGSAQTAYWASWGGPSWAYMRHYKQLDKDRQLEKPETEMRRVVTDYYFKPEAASEAATAALRAATGPLPGTPGAQPQPQAQLGNNTPPIPLVVDPVTKGKTLSWSLTYYLAQRRLTGLMNLYKEMSALPRDLDPGEEVVLQAFARAFDLLGPDGEIDQKKWTSFALGWHGFLGLEASPGVEIRDLEKPRAAGSVAGGGNLPGGIPPGGFAPEGAMP